ncbi:putative transcriptional regulator [Streptomyces sp. NBRC 110611]|uniref:helix-turn-helix domain-containing protein n=1 Tax=Streptomyces sp. NBRC 110611 TaxID=1621259 RepID=UPI00082F7442|nr:helix-turn-helix transcriptional regulator [Streptomyces sp. NBRC 110611]GAU65259.1 putative transcriptional regulator [Streptomyces sp. NBRC 110611]
MGQRVNPTYRQRRFGAEVRKLREVAGLSVSESAELMGMRQSHVSAVEAGRTHLSSERLRRLAGAVSGIRAPYVDALEEMAQASGKGWWSAHRERVRPSLLDVAELEAGAQRMVSYEPTFVPVLLQTKAYVAANFKGGYARASPERREAEIEFRMRRQDVLVSENPPRFHAVIHEAALHPTFGNRAIMREQLIRLIGASRLPNVTIQVVPFDGPVPFGTSFTLVEPKVAELGTVVVPHIERSLYLGDADSLDRYNDWFANLCEVALPPADAAVRPEAHTVKDSLGLIQRLLYPLL